MPLYMRGVDLILFLFSLFFKGRGGGGGGAVPHRDIT